MSTWYIDIEFQGKKYRLRAEMIRDDSKCQTVRISGRNRAIVLQNNLPDAKQADGSYAPLQWKLLEGSVSDPGFLGALINALEHQLCR